MGGNLKSKKPYILYLLAIIYLPIMLLKCLSPLCACIIAYIMFVMNVHACLDWNRYAFVDAHIYADDDGIASLRKNICLRFLCEIKIRKTIEMTPFGNTYFVDQNISITS